MNSLKEKVYKNALIGERLARFDHSERQKIIQELLKTKTERQLAEELGISHSTIHDWKTLRQDNTGKNVHVSLSAIYIKLKHLDASEVTDWGRLEQIREVLDKLLQRRINALGK